ncbi:MAG TPA: PqqD family protein [Armatimonadota bacterium]|nr:PqqD family protein [Armatimonadota bacterium]
MEHPRKREKHVVLEHVDDELLVYDQRSHRAHALNRTSALIWQHCDGRRGIDDLASLLPQESGQENAREVTRLSLRLLNEAGLLEKGLDEDGVGPRLSRRELGRRLGTAGALAVLLPAVTSIVAPTAAEAATCVTNAECANLLNLCKPCGPPNCTKRCDSSGNCSNAQSGC